MKVVNPAGRNVETGLQADYALRARCKCSSATLYSAGSSTGSCVCSDGNGTVGTRVYAG